MNILKFNTNVAREPRKYIFVRSSEIHKSRPCSEFVLNKPDNYCIRCKEDEEQTFHLTYNSVSGNWNAASGIKACSCNPVARKSITCRPGRSCIG